MASRDRELLRELLKGKDPSALEPRSLMMKAHWRWDRDQHYEAFLLFEASAHRFDEIGKPSLARGARNRSAVTLFRAGTDRKEALRRLREALAHYRETPADIDDRHWVEWLWTSLLVDIARERPKAFAREYAKAVADCAALGREDFPYITPHIETLAEAARDVGAKPLALQLVAKRRARKTVPKATKARLDAIERWARET